MSWRRMKLALMNCFKHISNGVLLGNGSNYPCGDTCCKRIGGDIPCYNTSCSNNTVISYCYAWTYNHISAKPAIISNGYRLGITQKAFYTIAAKHSSAFFSDHRMQGSDNGHIWPEIIVISYPKLTRAYTVRTGLFECPAVLLFAPCTPGTRRSSALQGTQTAAV